MILNRCWKKSVFMALTMTFVAEGVMAKTSVNAQCYLSPNSKSVVGSNTDSEFELASTSKVVTSYWALATAGPHARFKTTLHIRQVARDLYDVHISGSRNPLFNQEMTYFLLSELSRNGIKNINRLSFDENLKIFWRVREHKMAAARSFDPSPVAVKTILNDVFVNRDINQSAYSLTVRNASRVSVDMVAKPSVSAKEVAFISKKDFQVSGMSDTKTLTLQSAPLYKIIKEMNIYSNNYIADMLYNSLGGNKAFAKFAANNLKADRNDISFVNGSGDSEFSSKNTDHPASKNGRWYNKATCNTMIQVLLNMRTVLRKHNLDLDDVMAVSASDSRATLGARYANVPNTVVAKTGSVDPAIGLTGMIATDKGDVLFAVLMKTQGKGDWGAARNYIRVEVGKIIAKHGGADKVRYSPMMIMPFDNSSYLQASPSITLAKN